MRRSVFLRTEPSVHQTERIIRGAEQALRPYGVITGSCGVGCLRFRMPLPWRAPRWSALNFVTSGRIRLSAGAGGPWRLRYELSFRGLTVVTLVALAIALARSLAMDAGFPLVTWLVLWLLLYALPHQLATRRMHRLLYGSAADVVERRQAPRPAPLPPAAPPSTPPASDA